MEIQYPLEVVAAAAKQLRHYVDLRQRIELGQIPYKRPSLLLPESSVSLLQELVSMLRVTCHRRQASLQEAHRDLARLLLLHLMQRLQAPKPFEELSALCAGPGLVFLFGTEGRRLKKSQYDYCATCWRPNGSGPRAGRPPGV